MMKRLFICSLLLFIIFTVFVGVERYRYEKRIVELQMMRDARKEAQDFAPYIKGVKTGLQFKKHQQGSMPCIQD